ncbi:MAG: hypothetical protein LBV55_02255 [Acholeplasmatales bacterium]|jgi:hypothetical protein|nr:hypothetical protein [Acholeplasmatales bacterium]
MKLKYKIIILSLVALVLILGIIATIILVKQNNKEVLISANLDSSYVFTPDKKLSFSLWTNQKNHPLNDTSSISQISISSSDHQKLLTLELFKITPAGKENYLEEEYYKLIIYTLMPNLGGDYFIENYLLNITLVNQQQYHFQMGNISLMYFDNVGTEEAWTLKSLYGTKDETKVISRLKFIYLEGSLAAGAVINDIQLGLLTNCTYTVESNQIIICIDYQNLVFYNSPIIIHYYLNVGNFTQVIDNFLYFEEGEFLMTNGPLLNIYS